MIPTHKAHEDGSHERSDLFGAVGSVSAHLQAIEKFIARRFDEISMEINATSQQIDQSEEGIVRRFADILEILKAISFSGDGTTPANAGVELDAVVGMTEQAATRIMDATDRIASSIRAEGIWDTPASREAALETIDRDLGEILLACSFQDITGQRIRKTLEKLKTIEERLNGALTKMGIAVTADADPLLTKATSQSEIDDIFSKNKK